MSNGVAGQLLVATPLIIDAHFFRTVVLLLQHDAEGSMGVVLNRRMRASVSDHLPGWAGVVPEPGRVHWGGPVEPDIGLALSREGEGVATPIPGLKLLDLSRPPGAGTTRVMIYSGYAGWSEGQLEDELEMGSWYVVEAEPEDPFAEPEGLWSSVLRRQKGFVALVSAFPLDPSLN